MTKPITMIGTSTAATITPAPTEVLGGLEVGRTENKKISAFTLGISFLPDIPL